MVASISDFTSVHRETFKNAASLFSALHLNIDSSRSPSLLWEDDFASEIGGMKSALNLIKRKANIVIGHFASSAALSALETYNNQIPVLLPAATLDRITENHSNAFRLIGKDSDLIEYLFADINPQKNRILIWATHDGSLHGKNIQHFAKLFADKFNIIIATEYSESVNFILYSGSFYNSMEFLRNYSGVSCPILFTDDVIHPNIGDEIAKNKLVDITAYGYSLDKNQTMRELSDIYTSRFNKAPGTYFFETYSALQIALQIALIYNKKQLLSSEIIELLQHNSWDTALGKIKFQKGENNLDRYSKFIFKNGNLIEEK